MSPRSDAAAQAAIGAATRELHLPTIRDEAERLAEIAARERQTHLGFLAEALTAEVDDRAERRRARRIAEARFPRIKRLAEFNLDAVPGIAPAQLAALASGAWIDAGEPVVLLGDSGTGKTHLLIGLGLAACEQGRRVRCTTCAHGAVTGWQVAVAGSGGLLLAPGWPPRRPQHDCALPSAGSAS